MTRIALPTALRRLTPALLAVSLCAALPVAAQSTPTTVDVHLPVAPLQQSLNAMARQSGVQLLFAADSVAGRQAPALDGRYAPREALQRLMPAKAWTSKNARQACS